MAVSLDLSDPTIQLVLLLAAVLALALGALAWTLRRTTQASTDALSDQVSSQMAQLAEVTQALADRQTQFTQDMSQRHAELAQRQAEMTKSQGELAGRIQQSHVTTNERLDHMGKRLGDGLQHQSERQSEHLKVLQERLAVIDTAQRNITDLSQQMVGLQDILSNKQTRGAFGEIQLQDLVTAALPPSAFEFQASLSNGKRADCLLKLPNPPGPIVIDAKFPLESFQALKDATDEGERVQAARRFSQDVKVHVTAIADKYIVAGETAESALMFLPSEAVYAELHANFRNVVEESFRRRVWIVSPTTLMATLNTVRAVLKDSRMREQAHVIQAEVLKLMEDVGRLDDRVEKLQTHFAQASKDIGMIQTSTRKIVSRSEKIEDLQLSDDSPAEDLLPDTQPEQPRLQALGGDD